MNRKLKYGKEDGAFKNLKKGGCKNSRTCEKTSFKNMIPNLKAQRLKEKPGTKKVNKLPR